VFAGLAAEAQEGFVWSQRADVEEPAVGYKLPLAIEASESKSGYSDGGRVSF